MRRTSPCLLIFAVVLTTVSACSTTSSPARGGSGPIGYEDIAGIPAANAFEVIQRLRPTWLRGRGRMSIQNPSAHTPVIYLDNVRYGGLESLRLIPSDAIQDMRFINASDATTRYGTGHAGGAILIRSRG